MAPGADAPAPPAADPPAPSAAGSSSASHLCLPRMPTTHTDIDHRTRWADGGKTEDWNLAPLCDHNHGSKDRGGWHLEMIDPYTYKWTSPFGLK